MMDYWVDVDKALIQQHTLIRLIEYASIKYPYKVPELANHFWNFIKSDNPQEAIEQVWEALDFIPEEFYSKVARNAKFTLNPNFLKALDWSMYSFDVDTAKVHLLTRNDDDYVKQIIKAHPEFNEQINLYLKNRNPSHNLQAELTLDDMLANRLLGTKDEFDAKKYSGSLVTEQNKLTLLAALGDSLNIKPVYMAPQDELNLLYKDGNRGRVGVVELAKSYPRLTQSLRDYLQI